MILRAFTVLLFILTLANPIFAENIEQNTTVQTQAQTTLITPQNIAYANCTKMFPVNKEKLFYLALAAIDANKFEVDEIQTENGYIIFTVAENKYLATIAGIDAQNSILKITPCNDIYFFPPGVFLGIYKYIDLNINTEIK